MQEATTWANTICIVVVICALCEMMLPQGNVAKAFHFVLGMFLIVAILVPFSDMVKSGLHFKEKFSLSDNDVRLSGMDDLSIAYGKSVIENLVAETLEENQMTYKKITVTMDSSEGKCIDMIKVDICTDMTEQSRWKEYQRCVKEKTGIVPVVCAE